MYLKKPAKVNNKSANIKMRIDKTKKIYSQLDHYNHMINSAPDETTFDLLSNYIVMKYERMCEAIKELLDIIALKENISNISNKRDLGELTSVQLLN